MGQVQFDCVDWIQGCGKMLSAPIGEGGKASTLAGLGGPAMIVLLVLMLGATIYLWQARYLRRSSAYLIIAVLVVALALLARANLVPRA